MVASANPHLHDATAQEREYSSILAVFASNQQSIQSFRSATTWACMFQLPVESGNRLRDK